MDNVHENPSNQPEVTEPLRISRDFIDERPCVIPSIVNYHQQLRLTTNFYNLTNSFEPIRILDYFSRSITETQRTFVLDSNSNFTGYDPHSMAQIIQNTSHINSIIVNEYPGNHSQSQSVTESVVREVVPASISTIEIPASINNVADNNIVVTVNSVADAASREVPSTSANGIADSVANKIVPAPFSSDGINLVPPLIFHADDTMNKENNNPIDSTEESEMTLRQYCKHFKKKQATLMFENKANDLAKLMEISLKVNNDNENGLIKYFKYKKLNRLVKYSTAPVEVHTPATQRDSVIKRLPFKEQFSNTN